MENTNGLIQSGFKLVFAEKPSVGRDIAKVLGATQRGEGLICGNGYVVTWGFGHLVQMAEPEKMSAAFGGPWRIANLPMLPETWVLQPNAASQEHFAIVKELMNRCSEIINCADAGREGENIFRLVYRLAGCTKPFKRLWISSLTDEAIRQGFRQLKEGSAYDNLAHAAFCRQKADWLIGMNFTRAHSVHHGQLCTIGRVQTPTLAILVKREHEILQFKRVFYYELWAALQVGFNARWIDQNGKSRLDDEKRAQTLHASLQPVKEARVASVVVSRKTIKSPPLFDLINLQKECNQRLGLTAAQTLEVAQALYEKYKLISYPRTESRHLSEDMVPELPKILTRLPQDYAEHTQFALDALKAGKTLSKDYVDSEKLTDHHAIIPTLTREPAGLEATARSVYRLVVERFIAIFLPPCLSDETEVRLAVGAETFLAKGIVTVSEGFRAIEKSSFVKRSENSKKAKISDTDEELMSLPPLTQGQILVIEKIDLRKKESTPPKRYNDATLLNAMKHAGRDIDDSELKEAMKESGLGTPATRAEMIERLIKSGYISRDKKALIPTEKGIKLIEIVHESIKSPSLTAAWEQGLKRIEEGELSPHDFDLEITRFVQKTLPGVFEAPVMASQNKKGLGACPKCQAGQIIEYPKSFGCSHYRSHGCPFSIFKVVASKQLSTQQVEVLLNTGKSPFIRGFKSKAGKDFDAYLRLNHEFKVMFEFETQTSVKPTVHKEKV